jgi:hypothetical protein
MAGGGRRKLLDIPSWTGPIVMDSSGTEPRIPPGYFAKGSQTIQVIVHVIYGGQWGELISFCQGYAGHACASPPPQPAAKLSKHPIRDAPRWRCLAWPDRTPRVPQLLPHPART